MQSERHQLLRRLITDRNCIFCLKFDCPGRSRIRFGPLLNKALYSRYANTIENENCKHMNCLIENQSTKLVVNFKDKIIFEEKEEYLKRIYNRSSQQKKIPQLLEYYKFHLDVPRIFIKNVMKVTEQFHNKYKEIRYHQIKHLLGLDNQPKDTSLVKYSFMLPKLLESQNTLKNIVGQSVHSTRMILKELIEELCQNNTKVPDITISQSWFSMTRSNSHFLNLPILDARTTKQIPDIKQKLSEQLHLKKIKIKDNSDNEIQFNRNRLSEKIPIIEIQPDANLCKKKLTMKSKNISKYNMYRSEYFNRLKINSLQQLLSPHLLLQQSPLISPKSAKPISLSKTSTQNVKNLQVADKSKKANNKLMSTYKSHNFQQLILNQMNPVKVKAKQQMSNTQQYSSNSISNLSRLKMSFFQNKNPSLCLNSNFNNKINRRPQIESHRVMKKETSVPKDQMLVMTHQKSTSQFQGASLSPTKLPKKTQQKEITESIPKEKVLQLYKKWQQQFSSQQRQVRKLLTKPTQSLELKQFDDQRRLNTEHTNYTHLKTLESIYTNHYYTTQGNTFKRQQGSQQALLNAMKQIQTQRKPQNQLLFKKFSLQDLPRKN